MLVRFAHKRGHISQAFEITDLDKFIASKTKREKVGRVYNPEELSRMVECGCSEVAVLGILLGSKMGMRIGEFLSIEWNRIDFKKNCIEVWSKNKHWRTIPMTKDVAEYLKIRRKSFPDAKLVFGASRTPSKPMAKQVFYKYWVEMLLAAGIKGRARVHDLRHTFATKTARDNWPPTVACKLLDMSLQQYMKTYVHITYDDMVSLMQKSFGGNA
jgi:integrase